MDQMGSAIEEETRASCEMDWGPFGPNFCHSFHSNIMPRDDRKTQLALDESLSSMSVETLQGSATTSATRL